MKDLINDLSILTTIPEYSLRDLVDKAVLSICHDVNENLMERDAYTQIDIGIGKITIGFEDDEIKYKFIPSLRLERAIKDVISTHEDPLQIELENSLMQRIKDTYKELF